jgi:hypothetical protein
VKLNPLGTSAIIWLIVPAQDDDDDDDDDECGAVGGTTVRGNQSTRIKLTTVPLYPT